MKYFYLTIALASALTSCSTEKKEIKSSDNTEQKVIEQKKNENFVAIDSDEALIATALMAAPKESREGCKVIGYNVTGEFVTLKEGTNEFICLAHDIKKERFSAACYHKSLEPFMARGRELKAEGKSHSEIFDIREEEVKSGKLEMGKPGSTLHIYFGSESQYDPETSMVDEAIYRYVVYLPWATSETTGLPESPMDSNHPWIMNPGTHKAHIMISPLAEN